ncbi:hypothetical protein D3C77_261870 [compost metagenome]
MRLVVVAFQRAERHAAHARRRGVERHVAGQVAIGQVDVGAVRNGPGQTGDRLGGEPGRAVVGGEGHGRGVAQAADGVGADAVHAHAQADERTQGPVRRTEVIEDVGHQSHGLDVAFRRVAGAGGRGQVAQALRTRHGAHAADVARAVAAFEFGAPVGVEAVAEASEGRPAVVDFPVPVVARRRRFRVDVVDDVVAGVDRAVPAVGFSRSRAGCEQPRHGDTGQKFQLHGVLTLIVDPKAHASPRRRSRAERRCRVRVPPLERRMWPLWRRFNINFASRVENRRSGFNMKQVLAQARSPTHRRQSPISAARNQADSETSGR